MGEFIGRMIIGFLFEGIAMLTGWILVIALSFGTIWPQDDNSSIRLPWHGFGRNEVGERVVGSGAAMLIGSCFWLALFVGVAALMR